MSEPIRVKKLEHWLPVNVRRNEAGEPDAWFHPPCGDWHPFVDGTATCPVYAEANKIMAEGLKALEAADTALPSADGLSAAPPPTPTG